MSSALLDRDNSLTLALNLAQVEYKLLAAAKQINLPFFWALLLYLGLAMVLNSSTLSAIVQYRFFYVLAATFTSIQRGVNLMCGGSRLEFLTRVRSTRPGPLRVTTIYSAVVHLLGTVRIFFDSIVAAACLVVVASLQGSFGTYMVVFFFGQTALVFSLSAIALTATDPARQQLYAFGLGFLMCFFSGLANNLPNAGPVTKFACSLSPVR